MPAVSVVMPTYQRGWLLRRAIDSVLGQTDGDLELIVVDDGSTDDTADVVAEVRDPRLRYLWQPQAGSSAARNTALSVATGELVGYLDSDNVWHPQFVEVLREELSEGYVMAYCSSHLFLVGGSRERQKIMGRKVRSAPYNPAALMRGNYIDTNTVLHRRDVLDDVGGWDETLARLVDWDLFARIAIRWPFGVRHVDQVLCDYYYLRPHLAPTVTNSAMSDEALCGLFGLHSMDAPEGRVRGKIDGLLGRRSGPHLDPALDPV